MGPTTRLDTVTSVRATTLRSEVFGVLRKDILSGRLTPGMKLVESELAARLGVSRNPVREAIGRLEQQGLVVSIPNRGTFVVQPNAAQARDMFLLRAYLELLALRLAFADWEPERYAPLVAVRDNMRDLVRTAVPVDGEVWGAFSLLDTEFHTRLVQASGSAALLRAWETAAPTDIIFLYDRTRAGASSSDTAELEATVARHEALLHALQSGDARAAQTQLRIHFIGRSREGTVALDDASLEILGWDRTTLGDGPS